MDKKEICKQFLGNSTVNPATGRKIKKNGPTYNKLSCLCGKDVLEQCTLFSIDPTINPATGRKIKEKGPTYNKLLNMCQHFPEHIENEPPYVIPLKCNMALVTSTKLNSFSQRVVNRLAVLYKRWATGDVFALLESSYLIDYHCTQLLYHCRSYRYTARWEGNINNIDTIKPIDYATGWAEVIDIVIKLSNSLYDMLLAAVNKNSTRFINITNDYNPGRIVKCDWDVILAHITEHEFKYIMYSLFEKHFIYCANSAGMYRMVAFIGKNKKLNTICCITNALLTGTLLQLMGFPPERLFSHGEQAVITSGGYVHRHKKSHWSLSCRNPTGTIIFGNIPSYRTLYERNIMTGESFATYTRDIIWYYKGSDFSDIDTDNIRNNAVTSFLKLFDLKFPAIASIVRTPMKPGFVP